MESDSIDFIETQKKILPLMLKSHRMLTAYIYANLFIIYGVMAWVGLVLWWMGLPFQLSIVAFALILIPLLISPLIYRQVKRTYPVIQHAKTVLLGARNELNANRSAGGLFTYITLLFKILHPEKEESAESEIERTRSALQKSKRNAVSEIIFQGFIFTLAFANFIIPDVLLIIEQSGFLGLLGNPIMLIIGFIFSLIVIRWGVFIRWHLLVRRWLKLYQGFIEWGEELERMAFSSEREGGVNP